MQGDAAILVFLGQRDATVQQHFSNLQNMGDWYKKMIGANNMRGAQNMTGMQNMRQGCKT